jgi:hypothetical protein
MILEAVDLLAKAPRNGHSPADLKKVASSVPIAAVYGHCLLCGQMTLVLYWRAHQMECHVISSPTFGSPLRDGREHRN